jgi:transcriptional regulator with XRE-family HTH domain
VRDDTATEINRRFGLAVRELRLANGLTLAKLAELADCSDRYLSYIEKGEKSPTLERIYAIAEALGVTPSDLVQPPTKRT